MKRDDAIKILSRIWGGCPQHGLANRYADAFVALGMLKLEEPKGSNERAIDAMFSYPPCKSGLITPRHALEALDAAGLKIVEK